MHGTNDRIKGKSDYNQLHGAVVGGYARGFEVLFRGFFLSWLLRVLLMW